MVEPADVLWRLQAETETMLAETERLAGIDSGSEDAEGIARVCAAIGVTVCESRGRAWPASCCSG